MSDIGRTLGKPPATIYALLGARGGFSPRVRCPRPGALSLSEREDIAIWLSQGLSLRAVATRLGRAASTISREVAKNGGQGAYRPVAAEQRAHVAARRPKPCKLETSAKLARVVASKLAKQWSPEQIAGWLRRRHPSSPAMQVSHETIYKTLYIPSRVGLAKGLRRNLRTRRTMRRGRRSTTAGQKRGQIVQAVSIRERPLEANDRAAPGHWEGDLLVGSDNSQVATLVDRCSRLTRLVRISGKDTKTVVSALTSALSRMPKELRRTLTWDRGSELAAHQALTKATNVQVYFCDPQSPWQRGSNENTNRLLRQYMPKGMSLASHTQSDLNRIAGLLNERPRKVLNYQTPTEAHEAAMP